MVECESFLMAGLFVGPAPRVLASLEALAYIGALSADLDAPGAGFSLPIEAIFAVQIRCSEMANGREKLRDLA
jgi:hypothetical protein